jgi:RNA polymerase sigma-70 factor (ECF subfamily)
MSFLNSKVISFDYTTAKDEEILRASIKCPELFSLIIDRYEKPFLRKARSILRSREDSEDTVQEAFTKIYLNAGRFQLQEGASFKSWGYKILINTSFTHYQKLKKGKERSTSLTDEMQRVIEDPTTANSLHHTEITDYVASVLTIMPRKLSRVLQLHFIERRPQKEIAKSENLSVGAVKTRIYRAKREFRKISDYNLV